MSKKKIHWIWKILNLAFFCYLFPINGQETMDENLEIATFAWGVFLARTT